MKTPKRRHSMTPAQLEEVADLFAALSEPSRLALLQALHQGPQAVNQLMRACSMKQANVSKHLGVLHDHRLVERKREGISIRYQIADPMVFALCELVCGKIQRDAQCAVALFAPEI
jgi:DNA-binding transcriptional ArsR family regulator